MWEQLDNNLPLTWSNKDQDKSFLINTISNIQEMKKYLSFLIYTNIITKPLIFV